MLCDLCGATGLNLAKPNISSQIDSIVYLLFAMATSQYQTRQYVAAQFVESAGAVLFKVSSREICLVHHQEKDEWLLAKGRCNIEERRQATAIREVEEETGYEAELLTVTMTTRAPPAAETRHYPDEPHLHHNVCDPFMMTSRQLDDNNIKIIWWFIAAIDEAEVAGKGEMQFKAQLFGFDEALHKLTYELDRDIVREAIRIFEDTHGSGTGTEATSTAHV